MAINVIGPDIVHLDSIIRELVKLGAAKQAADFLAKYPHDKLGSREYSCLMFLVDQHLLPINDVIEKGRKLVSQGLADSESYRTLVHLLVEQKKNTLAEDVIARAVREYPELRIELYNILEGKKT